MITLQEIDMGNFSAVSKLEVCDSQKDFVGSPDWIIALAYADRSRNAHVMAIVYDETPVGLVMTSEFALEADTGFYYIPQFMIDKAYQRQGYGRQAMELVIDLLSAEGHYDSVRLDVHKDDLPAINLYRSLGFTETGYSDPANPELLFLGLTLLRGNPPELHTASLTLRAVDDGDIGEVARMWDWQNGPVSAAEAKQAVRWMQENHKKNKQGSLHHLCFAVFEKGDSRIIGWCGLDGLCAPGQNVLFYSIHSNYQNKGYATQSAGALLAYAFEELGISSVSGGCDKKNLASFRVMEKIGMLQNAFEQNGDPLFFIDRETYLNMARRKAGLQLQE